MKAVIPFHKVTTRSNLLILFFILPQCILGQSAKFPTKADITQIYSKAIGDFIKAANKNNNTSFDTLFFGKHINGQPDDFPDIELPGTIENTEIRLITPELGKKTQKERQSRVYINLIGWVNREKAEFIFVVFSNGFVHQYDYNINYQYNVKRNEFELDKLQFKGPPFAK